MRILIALTYYQPYISGLTIYAVRLANALAERGHEVKVLTSRYDKSLPSAEVLNSPSPGLQTQLANGVQVVRVPVLANMRKVPIMPVLPLAAWSLIQWADVVNIHVPQLDAAVLGILSYLQHKPVVMTYQCDLKLPPDWIYRVVNPVAHFFDRIAARTSHAIVAITRDYVENSPFLQANLKKVQVITPPVALPQVSPEAVEDFRQRIGVQPGQSVIGMVGRLATEKGVEYLVKALPKVLERYPQARVFYAGPYRGVLGEELYAQKLAPMIEALGSHWKFLDILPEADLASFYHVCDVLVLPSVNSTEAFGMVQVEAMICGTPVVATDLPGVRQPVRMTGMGKIVAPRDSEGLAAAIIAVLHNGDQYRPQANEIARCFSPQNTAAAYEAIFNGFKKK